MDSTRESDRLQHLYLTGVKPTGKDIGFGAYGKVFEVECFGTVHVAKEIHPILIQGVRQEEFEAMKKAFLTECAQSSALGHQNVVQVLGVYNPGDQSLLPALVMERMQESLTSVVEKYHNIPTYAKLSMLLDVSRGLWYLHGHLPPIVHRDLSPNNVLLSSQFVAKISDLGVAKVIRADSRKTKTRAPGTVDFMPPEALLKTPEYGPPLDIFSYGGVILHVVNQEWPEPLHYVITDPKTGKILALSEVERRQQHIKKMTGTPADLQPLVKQCLDNQPSRRPPISDVSERMKTMKEVESLRHPHVSMDPTTWQQPLADIFQKTIDPKTGKMLALSEVERRQQHMEKMTGTPADLQPLVEQCLDNQPSRRPPISDVSETMKTMKVVESLRHPHVSMDPTTWQQPLADIFQKTIDPKTGKMLALSEVERRQQHMEKMTGTPADLQPLVEQCLDNQPSRRPPISDVSETMKMMKVVKSLRHPHVSMDPTTWQQPLAEIFQKTMKWKEKTLLPACRNAHTAVLLGGVVYIGGGYEGKKEASYRLDAYNLATNQWILPPIATQYCRFAMTVLNEKLVTVGGRTENHEVVKKVLVLDAGEWKSYSEMPTARSWATAVGYHSMLIVIGGGVKVKDEWQRISTIELLDSTIGCWYTCDNLPSPHQQLKAAIMNDKLYLLGGFDEDLKPSSQVFVASLDTLPAHQLNWRLAPNTPWCSSAPVVLYNKFLLTVGGRQPTDYASQSSEVYALNPSTDQWICLSNNLPDARSLTATVSMDDKMIVIGGMTNRNKEYSNNVWTGSFE